MPHAFVALGSNLPSPAGDSARTLAAAIERLAELGRVTAASRLYRTAPAGYAEQPHFLNAVAAIETALAPLALLDRLLGIEAAFGRVRAAGMPNRPRPLDLDLLLIDDVVLATRNLELPHPRLAERRFVLAPLEEIAPARVHPILRRTVRELLSLLPVSGLQGRGSVHALS